MLTYTANQITALNYERYRENFNILCTVNLHCMLHLQELWTSTSKVMLLLFTIQLYTKLQIGNHNSDLPPIIWRYVVTGWDYSDFISRSLDIKSPCMLHPINN
jgi:hypothetical protein